jgi:hypothetical protein
MHLGVEGFESLLDLGAGLSGEVFLEIDGAPLGRSPGR